ncbi:hypothetical protein EOD39_1353 [Acipenser ruthenus]|uniref:Uncharacterized protein n=1 Tax=Acipenser ruthenus TaxID=7906 RepID=A0A444UDC6_ACIRT|nr:hypothetical protein EOD39_1353 [Acipenser ruthenus]
MTEKTQDLENRSRRQNLIIGLPENTEGTKGIEFVRHLLIQLFGTDTLEKVRPLEVERDHRTLAPKLKSNERPRIMIARLLRYKDRQNILDLARASPNLKYLDFNISIYPDFSTELQQKRRV